MSEMQDTIKIISFFPYTFYRQFLLMAERNMKLKAKISTKFKQGINPVEIYNVRYFSVLQIVFYLGK